MKQEQNEQSLPQQIDTGRRLKRSTIDILKHLREGRMRPGDSLQESISISRSYVTDSNGS